MNRLGLTLALLVASGTSLATAAPSAPPRLEFREGDRVVLLGAAFIERLQRYGYLETRLTAELLDRDVTYRNLGWSGDTVAGEARAVFGGPDDGFERLCNDVAQARPTWILICYGGNEAHAGGGGIELFTSRLTRLLDRLGQSEARLALITPLPHRRVAPEQPEPSAYNSELRRYVAVLERAAQARGLPVVDLFEMAGDYATDDGVTPSEAGYWSLSAPLAATLGAAATGWRVDIDAAEGTLLADNALLSRLEANRRSVEFQCLDRRLPPPLPPAGQVNETAQESQGRLRVRGLEAGKYALEIDGQHVLTATHWRWQDGLSLPWRGGQQQVEQLRRAIRRKNELYFHRYRPQNETYLFLFRKHEQGNNAVEIPRFDPLIRQQESRLRELRKPRPHVYRLVRVGS